MRLSSRNWWVLQFAAAVGAGSVPLWLARADPLRDLPSLAGGIDPLLQCGILQWVLRHPPISAEAWNAPFFWPSAHSLAFMDTLFGQALLVYPLPVARAWPALAYNLCLAGTLALTVLATVRLARELGLSRGAALLSALVFALGPHAAGHFHHLNQLPTPWLPLALWGLLRAARRHRDGALWIAVAVLLQPLWGVYNLAVLWMALLCVLPFVLPSMRHRGALVLAVVYALGLLWMVQCAQPYREAADALAGYVRGAASVGPYAGRPFDLLHPPSAHLLAWPPSLPGRPVLYAGVLWPFVALAGAWTALRRTEDAAQRGLWWGLALLVPLGVLLAFGRRMPVPGLGEITLPLAWLQDHFWALQSLRAPTRLFLAAALGLALFGSFLFDRLLLARPSTLRWALLAFCGLALVDLVPGRLDRVRAHPDAEERALIAELREARAPGAWMLVPAPCEESQERARDARAMLWAALSERPVAGGSSGFVPMPVRRLRRACCRGTGDACLAELGRMGVRQLVVERGEDPPEQGVELWSGDRWRLWELP